MVDCVPTGNGDWILTDEKGRIWKSEWYADPGKYIIVDHGKGVGIMDEQLKSLARFLRKLLSWNRLASIYLPWWPDFDLKQHICTVDLVRARLNQIDIKN